MRAISTRGIDYGEEEEVVVGKRSREAKEALPSPLPSPPPQSLGQSQAVKPPLPPPPSHHIISHSTPPQSPFMVDDKQPRPVMGVSAASDSTAHTPPESNDATDLDRKLAHFNTLNLAFQRDVSLAGLLEDSRRRLRAIHVASFNRYIGGLIDKAPSSDHQLSEQVVYEMARRREDQSSHDDLTSSDSESEYEDNEDDDQLIVEADRGGFENDLYFPSTGDVNSGKTYKRTQPVLVRFRILL